jgi:hypothetical protein
MEAQKRKYQKHKTDYTISVKYFVKPGHYPLYNQNGDQVDPIYIRIICQRQSTTIKSRLDHVVTKEELPNYLSDPSIDKLVRKETTTIIESLKLLKPDQNPAFKISDWQKLYERGYKPVFICCFLVLMYRLGLLFKQAGVPTTQYKSLDPTSVSVFQLLVTLEVPAAKELYNQYQEIFNLGEYEKMYIAGTNSFYQFCFWDLTAGSYQEMLRELLGPNSERVIEVIEDLAKDYPTLPFPIW